MRTSSTMPDAAPAGGPGRAWARLAAVWLACGLAAATPALAADVDLARAGQLVQAGKFQEALDLLAPFEEAARGDAAFNTLLGEAALGTDRPEDAKKFFERSLAVSPTAEAHLGLGRAYVALGDFAAARIEFQTVLRVDDLPPDLQQQAEIYARTARRLTRGERLLPNAYAFVGPGNYHVMSTPGTDAFGWAGDNDGYVVMRGGAGVNYLLPSNYTLIASVDFRYQPYLTDRRNELDFRWNVAASKTLGDHNLAAGLRGRWRTFGFTTDYRNDWGPYASWRWRIDAENQLSTGLDFTSRTFTDGIFYTDARNILQGTVAWTRAILGGRGSLTLAGEIGGEFATRGRIDGNALFLGIAPSASFTLVDSLGLFVLFSYQHYSFDTARPNLGPSGETLGIVTRYDDLWEISGGFSWEFAPGFSLNPEVIWVYDQSTILIMNYSSTEALITLRWDL